MKQQKRKQKQARQKLKHLSKRNQIEETGLEKKINISILNLHEFTLSHGHSEEETIYY